VFFYKKKIQLYKIIKKVMYLDYNIDQIHMLSKELKNKFLSYNMDERGNNVFEIKIRRLCSSGSNFV
jgi:hypothetical protein